jgi:predicted aspartyl protease
MEDANANIELGALIWGKYSLQSIACDLPIRAVCMIEIDPQDRPLHLAERKRPIRTAITTVLILAVILGAGIFYWQISSSYKDVYKQLNITPLPFTLQLQPRFYNRLDQLSREPCYQDAIIGLSDDLLDSGYPRESARSLLAFARRCGDTDSKTILTRAYIAFKKLGDLSAALQIADQLVNSDPADAQYRYSRGAAYEQLSAFSKVLTDYIAALQLLGTPYKIAGSQFYDISRMYAALGRYCDAIGPIETFISFNPAERRTPQTTKIISEYAEKGACDTRYARGVGRAPLLNATGIHTLSVVVNGVTGNFILDSGATYVAVTPEFSAKAKINIETAKQLPMKTVGGTAIADLGYAKTISVGNAEAEGVAVAVIRGSSDLFGDHLDGLLGMSFLARFNLRLSQDSIELTPIPLR